MSRGKLLAAANHAAARGKLKKAGQLLGELLEEHPGDPEIHRKAAPVLAKLGRSAEAWKSFQLVAESLRKSGFGDKTIGIYREAAHYMPQRAEIWLAIAEIQLDQHRPSDAVKALLDGRRYLRSRSLRGDAIRLLSRANAIQPLEVDATRDLARLLRRAGRRREAYALIESALHRTPRSHRRALRAAQLALSPTPAAFYRWLRNPAPARGARRRRL